MNINTTLYKVHSGIDIPKDVNVIIEISSNSSPIKYEIDKENGILFVDRFIPTSMFYPCNYGYINHTLSLDGDPVDVLVITPYSINSGSVIRCRPVGALETIDESGEDIKILAVPHKEVSREYDHIIDICDVCPLLKERIIHFFKHYKDLEDGKWLKVKGWVNVEKAEEEIIKSFERNKIINCK